MGKPQFCTSRMSKGAACLGMLQWVHRLKRHGRGFSAIQKFCLVGSDYLNQFARQMP
ncbi:hypothetical protein QZM91_21020 [Burkholderia multivorans]|uniref:hypothetical protein n=1 Tax=Burkholderia multivorans TaxID=87883 RepID=UPI00050E6F91|nr:hypothetical protein [Burkholderia multivorans]KGC07202.1 hypothetical protein DM81_4259 [Burkholderia multivorans]MBU9611802.1 hypothetical protein [Burkholderia multivorans]MBU9679580.1 hypothetical protein [Burkholderia multivorans]MCO8575515.1 hypothetical protein [Burkholderia multivorans]MDN7475086.1 hypothetical protein [Burkholderia multivorans]